MANKKKFVMPKMDLEGAPPEVIKLAAVVALLTDRINAAGEEIACLEAEVSRLKEGGKRGARTPQ